MNNFRKLYLALALGSLSNSSFAQGATGITSGTQSVFPQFAPNVLPASPDAFSFTKYGNLPIGISTGTAQFNVPVYTVKSGSLAFPISLNYSSNGVKVDEMATRVGINWNLSAGGMITRNVMDLPDDAAGVYPTFFHGPLTWDNSLSSSWDLYNYVRQASYAGKPDYQPDEYSFTVDGYSGKFLKRENGEFTQFTSSGIKIEKNTSGFILTAPTGVKYYFYLSEIAKNYSFPENTSLEWVPSPVPTAWYLSKIVSPNRDSIIFNYSTFTNQITYKNGISQDYQTGTNNGFYINTSSYQTGYRGAYAPSLPYLDVSCNVPGIPTTLVQLTDNSPKYISSISFKGGNVHFSYSERLDVPGEKKLDSIKVVRSSDNKVINCMALGHTYSYAAPGPYDTYVVQGVNFTNSDSSLRRRLFLTSIEEVSSNISLKNKYSFEYDSINYLPPRLSFAQDRFGSFNGKLNSYFFPNDTWYDIYIGSNQLGGDRTYNYSHARKGMLKKINYPTGGFTQFSYEPNKTEDEYAYVYRKDSVFASFDTSTYVGEQVISDTIQYGGLTGLSLRLFCEWASEPVPFTYNGVDTVLEGTYRIDFDIENVNTNTCVACSYSIQPGWNQIDGAFGNAIPAGTYRIKATANRPHLRAKIVLTKVWKEYDRSEFSGISGVRVKSISDFAVDNAEINRREFIYGNWGDSASSSGTGLNIIADNGNEVSMTRSIQLVGSNPRYCGYNTIHSNSVLSNYRTENNTVFYKKVIELNSTKSGINNGGTEYEFYYDQKLTPLPISFSWGESVWDPVPAVPSGAPFANNDHRTGMIKSQRQFTFQEKHGSRQVLQESFNYYSMDTARMSIDTILVSKEVIKRDGRAPSWIYNFDFDIYRYWRHFGFLKLDSTVTVQKSAQTADEIKNKVVYFNYNLNNYQPSDIRFYSSNGDVKMTTRKFVPDVMPYEDNYSTYLSMKQANMIDGLLEERDYISTTISDNTLLTKKRMRFLPTLGMYLPSTIYSAIRTNNEYLEQTFQQYDSVGNIQQYTGKDGITISIVWGYDKRYPVAKVAGKSYNDAISQSGINLTVINNPSSEAALKTELDKLRNLSSCLVTTYIYDPMVGVKSETDANGKSVYYEYDAFNRLALVRDKDNNVVKKICYNFQGQPVDCGYGTEAAWTVISSTCEVINGSNTGNLIVTEKDMNPSSSTYSQTRAVTIYDARTCLAAPSCTGLDKKIVNGICETGVKVCTGNFRPPGQGWQHYYHYLWSDGSTSQTYIGQGGCMEL